ncbi:hypothetical protein CTI12_AA173540 [Artemisia annua]|uniref:ATPase, F1/V1/A1 complex, alpha/beta subunit, Zinc knuckle CX2CX4HX4C n=1 Tax=Artemisia annua TaxID=35608 RepID=A0A2U1PBA0_ARTAN|nr:hypothetical protein CTI12_AA173540 [Artemisia annua]
MVKKAVTELDEDMTLKADVNGGYKANKDEYKSPIASTSVLESNDKTKSSYANIMCQYGKGRLGYARVLIDVQAKQDFREFIIVQYRYNNGIVIKTKRISVEYSWKPTKCEHCQVFGHSLSICKMRPRTSEEEIAGKEKNVDTEKKMNNNGKNDYGKQVDYDGFMTKKNAKTNDHKGNGYNQQKNRGQYMGKKYEIPKPIYRKKVNTEMNANQNQATPKTPKDNTTSGGKKTWNVDEEVVKEVRNTANKYSVLQDLDDDGYKKNLSQRERNEVENCAKLKMQPASNVKCKWSQEMNEYFKECWDRLHGKNKQ